MTPERKALAELVDTLQAIADIKDEKAGDELAFAQHLARRAIALSADTREEARPTLADFSTLELCRELGGRLSDTSAARPSEPELRITGGGKVSVDPAAVLARHKADTDARPADMCPHGYSGRALEMCEECSLADAARPSAEEALPVAQEPDALTEEQACRMHYRGNSVRYAYDKLRNYQTAISECFDALRAAGIHIDGVTPLKEYVARLARSTAEATPRARDTGRCGYHGCILKRGHDGLHDTGS